MDYSNWMAEMAGQIRLRPLRQIALPGTHDSGTFGITGESDISPDAPEVIRKADEVLGKTGGLGAAEELTDILGAGGLLSAVLLGLAGGTAQSALRSVTAAYARAQSKSITDQLTAGIRVLDLRVFRRGADPSGIWIVHSMYSFPLRGILEQIRSFLLTHEHEIVILKFGTNVGGSIDQAASQELLTLIEDALGELIAPHDLGVNVTPGYLWTQNRRVVIVFRGECLNTWTAASPLVWPGDVIDSRTSLGVNGTTDLATLKSSLDKKISEIRRTDKLFELGIGLTPDLEMILLNASSSLKEQCAAKATPAGIKWVTDEWSNKGINIFSVDFYELADTVEAAIQINRNFAPGKGLDPDFLPADLSWTCQGGWRSCQRCGNLYYPSTNDTHCAAGGSHESSGDRDYTLVQMDAGFPGEDGWRQCQNCQCLFRLSIDQESGAVNTGRCPAAPDGHQVILGWNYALLVSPVDLPAAFVEAQTGWRHCDRCHSLFHSTSAAPGLCVTGEEHLGGQTDYTLGHWRDIGEWSPISPPSVCTPGQSVTTVPLSSQPLAFTFLTVAQSGATCDTTWTDGSDWQDWHATRTGVVAPDQELTVLWAPLSVADSHLDVFTSGDRGGVYQATWEKSAGWQGWYQIASPSLVAPGQPVAAAWAPTGKALHLFAVGREGEVHTSWWNIAEGWHGWEPLPGLLLGPGNRLTALGRSQATEGLDRVRLYVTGGDGRIQTNWQISATGWHGWVPLGTAPRIRPGQPLTATWNPGGYAELFTIDTDGSVLRLSEGESNAPDWRPLTSLEGWVTPGQRLAVQRTSPDTRERLEIFASNDNGDVMTARCTENDQWRGWWRVGQPGLVMPGRSITALRLTPSRVDLVAVGRDGGLHRTLWSGPSEGLL